MAGALDTTFTDGRSLRRSRNRDAVLDAVITRFESGDLNPSIDAIAETAGVSNRSIYRYFEHRDVLIREAVSHAVSRIVPEITLADIGRGPFEERVDRFVDHRLRMYHRLAPITRAAKIAAASEPIVSEEFEAGRLILRQSFLDHFAEEFAATSGGARTRAVIAAEIAFQFDAFEFLARATEGRPDEMRSILIEHLHLHLGRLRVAQAR